MEVKLEPCPFCGGRAEVVSREMGCNAGMYFQNYWCGCKKCNVGFYGRIEFILSGSELRFIVDAYRDVTEKWNRRATDERPDKP